MLLLLVIAVGCQPRKDTGFSASEKPKEKGSIELNSSESFDSLSVTSDFGGLGSVKARNVGEFFDHRLKFYKVDRPDMDICGSQVKELMLYFIDSSLVRLRYDVGHNVSNQLLDSLGLSRFKPLDSLSKELLRSKKVYDRIRRRLNGRLANYELVWRKGNAVNRFRVNRNMTDSTGSYLFYTEMTGYKKKLRELEIHYNYLEATLPATL